MITMESIKAKLGFDPLTYKIKNEEHRTGDGDFNPFSVLTTEELDSIMDTIRKQKRDAAIASKQGLILTHKFCTDTFYDWDDRPIDTDAVLAEMSEKEIS